MAVKNWALALDYQLLITHVLYMIARFARSYKKKGEMNIIIFYRYNIMYVCPRINSNPLLLNRYCSVLKLAPLNSKQKNTLKRQTKRFFLQRASDYTSRIRGRWGENSALETSFIHVFEL
uniref:Uncharacterized protein n=1 Tax=Cacopsylla melanoneura TaxID=428564 RepID=A0A8D8YNK4_9HEMI